MNSMHWFCISNEFKENQTDINYFKNYTITNVGIPRVSQCVQHTILYLVPAFFLLFFSPIVVYALHKCHNGPLHVRTPVTYRLFTTSLLFLNIIVQVGYYFTKWIIDSDEQEATLINGVKPLFRLYSLLLLAMSMLIAFSLQIASRKYGLVTSGVLFNYWLLLAICGAPQLYESVENLMDQKNDLFIAILFVIYYCVTLLTLFISCFPDRPKSQILNSKVTPEYTVSFINNISFWWFNGMARLGNTRPLIMEDLWDLAKHDQSRHLVVKFEKIRACQCKTRDIKKSKIKLNNNNVEETELLPSNSQMDKEKKGEKPGRTHNTKKIPSLIWALFLTFNHTVLGAFAYKLFYDLLQFAPPKLLDLLIQFMQDQNQSIWTGVGIALCMSVVYIVQSMILHQYFHTMFRLGMNVRSVLCSTVYKKALLLSSGARKNRTIGEIVNLMSVDIQRFQDMTTWIMYFWSAPLQVSLALFFLYRLLGLSVIAGLICLIAFIPFNAKISMAMRNYQQKQMALKDERLKLLNEMLSGIKVLKLYAWEKSIENRILAIRKKELDILKKEAYLHALSSMSWACAPFLVAVSTFTAYIIIDPANNILTPRITFVGISLFNILRFPLAIFSMVGSQAIQCAVSNKRLKVFLAEDEIQSVPNEIADPELAITLNDASFSWDQEENNALLKGINLTIKKGSLVAIVGRIGAGKSSLFSAILGEMYRNSGTVSINGRVAYIPQQAWIQNMTFKENILFGNEFEQDKYECVLDACALRQDLSALPIGDETEIGEKGINLSGGQKQRISLARAAYSDSDIYFLDDPLSAVDSHVGKHIFENLIDSENGMLRGKTRLLITHGLSFLKHCDQIILLKDGVISESGTYHDLLESSGEFSEIIKEYLLKDTANEISGQGNHELEEVEDLEQVQFKRSESCSKKGSDVDQLLNEKTGESSVKDVIPVIRHRKQHAKDQQQENGDVAQPLEVKDGTTLTSTTKNRGRIIEKEEVFTGKVKFSVYLSYLRAVGHEICITFFLIYIGSSVLGVFCNLTLANWADHAKEIQTTDTLSSATISNLSIYTSLGMAQAISVSFGSILMAIGMIRASRILHNRMLRSTLRSPMSFFDVTPLGRIMNRFGKDVNSLDMDIPRSFSAFLRTILVSLETIIVITYSTPQFAVVILPLLIFYGFVLRYYVSTSRQLKRLDSTTRSPIYSHFQESVQGASSIRAYNCVDRFLLQSEKHVDYNAIAYYHSIVANRWLAVRLELVGNLIIFFSALSAVLFRDWRHVTAGLAGLSVSYALSVTQTLNWAVRMTSELETNIVSVERIDEYTITPNEAAMETPANLQLDERWPEKGEILFENLSLRYRPDLDLVLKGVTAEIHSKEKIGIIGRTGAGKSSLTLALFRIVEPSEGRILIDEIDIAKIGLYDLRSRLTIVPQDPVLFTGTLRNNLDPFENYETADIWSALELTHMSEFVKGLPERLDHKITESGENLSVGQRQLLCLARALLRQSKVLVLDEAAASVDIETDHLIQSTIREQFRDCTVLTIAHRLHSVLNSQRILVFSDGRVIEFDTPQNLFLQPNSMFRSLAIDAGITSIDASNSHLSGDVLPNNNGLVETNKI